MLAEGASNSQDGIRHLSLLLTTRCNLACAYCYRPRTRGRRMPKSLALAAIDRVRASPVAEPTLLFTGGEPLLAYPLLRQAILHARRPRPNGERLRIQINTNGMLLSAEIASFLAEQEVEVQLSLDGVPPAQLWRGRRSASRLRHLLPELKRRQPHWYRRRLSVAATVGPETLRFLADSFRHFLSQDLREIRWGAVFSHRGPDAGPLEPLLEEQLEEVVADSVRHYRSTGETPLTLFRPPAPEGRRDGNRGLLCQAADGGCLAVDPGGETSVCPFLLGGDFPGTGPKGRARSGLLLGRLSARGLPSRLRAVAEASAAGVFRREGKRSDRGDCATCELGADCWACPASILFDRASEDLDHVPGFPCAFMRAVARHRARYLALRGPGYREEFREVQRSVQFAPAPGA